MTEPFDMDRKRAIRMALAQAAYRTNLVRIIDAELAGFKWLVASHRGLFAVAEGKVKTVLHGWFFGICRFGDHVYLFENCAMRDRSLALGRIIRVRIVQSRLCDPEVLVTGLDANCHQLVVIDDLLWLVDTANQMLRRFKLDGTAVDTIAPFPIAGPCDTSGAYLHINSVAKCGGRIGVMLHNGKTVPQTNSEVAWLGEDLRLVERHPIAGHRCHDIVEDEQGTLWHSASMAGDIISSDGRRANVSDYLMTRGIALTKDRMVVGLASFGMRDVRAGQKGAVAILDRDLNLLEQLDVPGPPTDIVTI